MTMRKLVLQMMTTMDGRLDDPMAWVHGVSDDQYRQIDASYRLGPGQKIDRLEGGVQPRPGDAADP